MKNIGKISKNENISRDILCDRVGYLYMYLCIYHNNIYVGEHDDSTKHQNMSEHVLIMLNQSKSHMYNN